MQHIKIIVISISIIFSILLQTKSQTADRILSLDSILDNINRNNLMLKTYDLQAEAYKFSAEASSGWMAPMIGLGTFMTPYPGQKLMNPSDKGMLMLQVEQDIPSPAKIKAKKNFINSQSGELQSGRAIILNGYRAQAKLLYVNWLAAKRRIKLLEESKGILQAMHKLIQIRYSYNKAQLSELYKIEAAIEDSNTKILMQETLIAKARLQLNALMNRSNTLFFDIDQNYEPKKIKYITDSAELKLLRMDIGKMNAEINTMKMNIAMAETQRLPDFKLRFDHMSPFAGMMPQAFSAMVMVSIPIAPWSSKMYKSDIKAMEVTGRVMQNKRDAILREAEAAIYSLTKDIEIAMRNIDVSENKVIPLLRKAFEADFAMYRENKTELPSVLNDRDTLLNAEMDLLDQKLVLHKLMIEYEKETYR